MNLNGTTVKIIKLNNQAKIPTYGSNGAAGFDFYASEKVIIMPGETILVGTGLCFELTTMTELQVRPRSGISSKTKIRVALGTVDQDYRGEVKIIIDNTGVTPYTVNIGDRIAQGVISPVLRAEFSEESLSETVRGSNGFGSSGI